MRFGLALRILICLLASTIVQVALFAQEVSNVTYTVAGTFNDWNAADPEWRMTAGTNGLFEVRHFFKAGHYKFKFTVDGKWDKHYGVGLDGKLTQPGNDIILYLERHGYNAIVLDPVAMKWHAEPATMDNPYAVLKVRGASEINEPITLDATESVARPGQEILDYQFGQFTGDVVQAKLIVTNAHAGKVTCKLPEGGTYHFWLCVNDGLFSPLDTVTLTASNSYQIVGDWTTNNPNEPSASLERTGEHTFDKIVKSTEPGDHQLILIRNHDEGDLIANLAVSVTHTNTTYWRVRYDETAKALTCEPEQITEFAYRPADDPVLSNRFINIESVVVAGDFNKWSTDATPMTDQGDGTYVAYLKLEDGLHQYKYVVNGEGWMQDPKADPALRADDGHGGFNSGIFIGERGESFGKPQPDAINMAAVRHYPSQATFFNVVAADQVDLKLRTLRNDVAQVRLHAIEKGKERVVSMRRAETQFGFDFWTASLFPDETQTNATYWFTLIKGPATNDFGTSDKPYVAKVEVSFPTPDWAKNVVWYQIFPERFRNGSIENDPPRTVPWRWDWYKVAAWERMVEGKQFSNDWYGRRFGGDFQGVIAKLPYFKELGVTGLYFCPVFESNSNHGYDTVDYRHISQWFGTKGDNEKVIPQESLDPSTWQFTPSDKLFLDFVKQAHAQGLKVIVDGVFNHMGRGNFALKDVLKNGQASPYADWFEVTEWGPPVKYKSWDGGGAMPVFKKDARKGFASATAKQYIFDITKRWMDPNGDGDVSDGVDGWRLDVAEDVPPAFWRDWRKQVKSINPRAYITGEAWGLAPRHLEGDEWDAVMNYQFAMRAIHFFIDHTRKISATEFDRQLKELLATYPMQVNFVMQNLYDSHDTDRLANMVINPDRDYDGCNRPQDGCPYNGNKPGADAYRTVKLMATFQACFLGAPMIWYGDEAGMFGADDPTDRKPMLWKDLEPYDNPQDTVMDDVWEHYRRVIAIRNTCPALRTGSFQTLLTDDAHDIYAFTRTRGEQVVVCVFNDSDKDQAVTVNAPWPDGSQAVDLMSATPVTFEFAPMSSVNFPQFDKNATVRVIRAGSASTGVYAVNNGRVTISVPHKGAAILVRR